MLLDACVLCGLEYRVDALSSIDGDHGYFGPAARYAPILVASMPNDTSAGLNEVAGAVKQRLVLPPHLPMCCLPGGVEIVLHPSKADPASLQPRTYSIVLTGEDGARLYATCVLFFEEVPAALRSRYQLPGGAVASRVLAVLGRRPYLALHEAILREVYLSVFCTGCPAAPADVMSHLLRIPDPAEMGREVHFELLSAKRMIAALPHATVGSAPLEEQPLAPLFEVLSIENVLRLFLAVLLERRVLLRSSRERLMTLVAEALRQLLFPLGLLHVYIPVLPLSLLDYLEAPTPFLMGLHSSVALESHQLEHIIMVDLDSNLITQRDDADLAAALRHPAIGLLRRRLQALLTPSVLAGSITRPTQAQRQGHHHEAPSWRQQQQQQQPTVVNHHRGPAGPADVSSTSGGTAAHGVWPDGDSVRPPAGGIARVGVAALAREEAADRRRDTAQTSGPVEEDAWEVTLAELAAAGPGGVPPAGRERLIRLWFLKFFSTLLRGYHAFIWQPGARKTSPIAAVPAAASATATATAAALAAHESTTLAALPVALGASVQQAGVSGGEPAASTSDGKSNQRVGRRLLARATSNSLATYNAAALVLAHVQRHGPASAPMMQQLVQTLGFFSFLDVYGIAPASKPKGDLPQGSDRRSANAITQRIRTDCNFGGADSSSLGADNAADSTAGGTMGSATVLPDALPSDGASASVHVSVAWDPYCWYRHGCDAFRWPVQQGVHQAGHEAGAGGTNSRGARGAPGGSWTTGSTATEVHVMPPCPPSPLHSVDVLRVHRCFPPFHQSDDAFASSSGLPPAAPPQPDACLSGAHSSSRQFSSSLSGDDMAFALTRRNDVSTMSSTNDLLLPSTSQLAMERSGDDGSKGDQMRQRPPDSSAATLQSCSAANDTPTSTGAAAVAAAVGARATAPPALRHVLDWGTAPTPATTQTIDELCQQLRLQVAEAPRRCAILEALLERGVAVSPAGGEDDDNSLDNSKTHGLASAGSCMEQRLHADAFAAMVNVLTAAVDAAVVDEDFGSLWSLLRAAPLFYTDAPDGLVRHGRMHLLHAIGQHPAFATIWLWAGIYKAAVQGFQSRVKPQAQQQQGASLAAQLQQQQPPQPGQLQQQQPSSAHIAASRHAVPHGAFGLDVAADSVIHSNAPATLAESNPAPLSGAVPRDRGVAVGSPDTVDPILHVLLALASCMVAVQLPEESAAALLEQLAGQSATGTGRNSGSKASTAAAPNTSQACGGVACAVDAARGDVLLGVLLRYAFRRAMHSAICLPVAAPRRQHERGMSNAFDAPVDAEGEQSDEGDQYFTVVLDQQKRGSVVFIDAAAAARNNARQWSGDSLAGAIASGEGEYSSTHPQSPALHSRSVSGSQAGSRDGSRTSCTARQTAWNGSTMASGSTRPSGSTVSAWKAVQNLKSLGSPLAKLGPGSAAANGKHGSSSGGGSTAAWNSSTLPWDDSGRAAAAAHMRAIGKAWLSHQKPTASSSLPSSVTRWGSDLDMRSVTPGSVSPRALAATGTIRAGKQAAAMTQAAADSDCCGASAIHGLGERLGSAQAASSEWDSRAVGPVTALVARSGVAVAALQDELRMYRYDQAGQAGRAYGSTSSSRSPASSQSPSWKMQLPVGGTSVMCMTPVGAGETPLVAAAVAAVATAAAAVGGGNRQGSLHDKHGKPRAGRSALSASYEFQTATVCPTSPAVQHVASSSFVSPPGHSFGRTSSQQWPAGTPLSHADVLLVDLMAGKQLSRLAACPNSSNSGGGCITALTFSPSGATLATATAGLSSATAAVRLWDVRSCGGGSSAQGSSSYAALGSRTASSVALAGHQQGVTCLLWDDDGVTLYSGGRDGSILAWDTRKTAQAAVELRGHCGWVNCLAVLPSAGTGPAVQRLVSGGEDWTVRIWDLGGATGGTGHGGRGTGAGHAGGTGGGAIGTILGRVLAGHNASVTCCSIAQNSRGGALITSGSADGGVSVWDATSGRGCPLPPAHEAAVALVAVTPLTSASCGHMCRITSVAVDNTVTTWECPMDLPSRSGVARLPCRRRHGAQVPGACHAFDTAHGVLISGDSGGTVKTWQVK